MNLKSSFAIGALLAATAQLGFAAKAIFIKLAYAAYPGLDAVTLLALRMIFSLPFFLFMLWWALRGKGKNGDQKLIPLTRQDWWTVLGLGFCGYYLASFLDFWGLQYISAGLERLILFTNPSIVVVLSALFLAVPITRRVALALLISYGGLALAYWHDLRVTSDIAAMVKGSLMVFGSAVSYSIYLILGAKITKRVGSTRFTAYMMIVATAFVLLQFVLMRPLSALNLPLSIYGYSVALAVFSTIVPVWMMAEALKRMGANDAAMFGSVGPVLTIFLGALFLDEQISLMQMVGAALVLGGVAMISMKKAPVTPVATTTSPPKQA